MRTWRLVPLLLLASASTWAGDACPLLRTQTASPDPATRIAAIACREHAAWFRPFIDRNGRLASMTTMEAESSPLSDGQESAWQRVARYWRDSGLLGGMGHRSGASDCQYGALAGPSATACRAFVVDTPWSAAFISWVMRQAALPGFRGSSRHYSYVRDAYLQPATHAYDVLDIAKAKLAVGDLLCYVRHANRVYAHEGLLAAARGHDILDMHCDIVVAVNPDNDSIAYLIGGNVQQGVTMRMLPLNRNGEFWGLPLRVGDGSLCAPDNEAACSFNRQDWAALLKLKPADELAKLPGALPPTPEIVPAEEQKCCVHCVVGAGVPRCPKPETP
ncbi:DUF2272 domain-containing protein [Pseudoxanthomonas putridarboris]|uniref:DUF2272 domain-containing protein n=1 Tax=Pseudoxanthomonas putridarboris TaxID=752605 RepID=A0ABU9IXP5_9GAMM